MRRDLLLRGAIIGGVTSLGLTGLSSLGEQLFGLPFVPFDLFDWMVRILPGPVLSLAISTMVAVISGLHLGPTAATAKLAEQTMAVILFLVIGIIFGLVVAAVSRSYPERAMKAGLIGGGLLTLVLVAAEAMLGWATVGPAVTILWVGVLLVGWGWILGRWALGEAVPAEASPETAGDTGVSRREVLFWLWGASLGLALAAFGLSRANAAPRPAPVTGGVQPTPQPLPTDIANTGGPAASPPLSVLDKRLLPAPGTRPELTKTADFYRIDINVGVPTTDINTWRLKIDGLVDNPLALTIQELYQMPFVSQAITLECISNYVGGDLISTGIWTGVPFKTVLAKAGLKPAAKFFNIQAFDGFYESVGLDEAMDERTMLVYDMNGVHLPPEHGYPLRIYIPNHYGMKQPKWIEHIEASDRQGAGYWVDRGWSQTAIVETTSVIDAVATGNADMQNHTVPVGGIAYAGARGISKVEVQVDGGPWVAAELRKPPLSPLTWVEWRYDYPYQAGRHVFQVRAYDGTGKPQATQYRPPEPDGATGLDMVSVDL